MLSKGSLYKGSSAVPFTSVGDLKAISTDDSIDLEFRNPTSVISKALLSKRANLPKFTAMNEEILKLAAQKIALNDGHYIAAAFKEGLANSSSYTVEADSGTLDSHSDHPGNHMRAQKGMWEQKKLQDLPLNNSAVQSLYQGEPFFLPSSNSLTNRVLRPARKANSVWV